MAEIHRRMLFSQFQEIFQLAPEDEHPSSYWDESMVMISAEDLPDELQMYCEWCEFCDRTWKDWFFHAPSRVFRKVDDETYLLGQKNKEWIVYDVQERTIKHLINQQLERRFDSFMSVFQDEN